MVFIQQYGWYLLVGIVALIFLKNKFQPFINKQKKKREEAAEYNNYGMNDVVRLYSPFVIRFIMHCRSNIGIF